MSCGPMLQATPGVQQLPILGPGQTAPSHVAESTGVPPLAVHVAAASTSHTYPTPAGRQQALVPQTTSLHWVCAP